MNFFIYYGELGDREQIFERIKAKNETITIRHWNENPSVTLEGENCTLVIEQVVELINKSLEWQSFLISALNRLKLILIEYNNCAIIEPFSSVATIIRHPLFTRKQRVKLASKLNLPPDVAFVGGGLANYEYLGGLRKAAESEKPVQTMNDYKKARLAQKGLFVSQRKVTSFGGLNNLREILKKTKKEFELFSGRNLPRGWLLIGPPGTGKSYITHFIAHYLNVPLIQVRTEEVAEKGILFLRSIVEKAEAAAPLVLAFDEIDKLFQLNNSSLLGYMLTWLDNKESACFVVGNLNRIKALPVEVTRIGRFDYVFYVGLPTTSERKHILQLHIKDVTFSKSEWSEILSETINMSGNELEFLVKKTKRIGPISKKNLLLARKEITSLYERDPTSIRNIQNEAKYIAVNASTEDDESLLSLWED